MNVLGIPVLSFFMVKSASVPRPVYVVSSYFYIRHLLMRPVRALARQHEWISLDISVRRIWLTTTLQGLQPQMTPLGSSQEWRTVKYQEAA